MPREGGSWFLRLIVFSHSRMHSFFGPICHMRQLRGLRTEHQIRGSLDELPRDIDNQLLRAWSLGSANSFQGRIRHVMRLVRHAVRPMTIPELEEALTTAESNGKQTSGPPADIVIEGCSSLLI